MTESRSDLTPHHQGPYRCKIRPMIAALNAEEKKG